MKILAINGCPPNYTDTVSMLLEQFLDGAKESGAEAETLYTEALNINPCQGCTEDIEFVSNGKCKCDDDMVAIYPKLKASDAWIFAAPNLLSNSSPSFRNLLDRLEPLFQLQLEETINQKHNNKSPKQQNTAKNIQKNKGSIKFSELQSDSNSLPHENLRNEILNKPEQKGLVVFISSDKRWDKNNFQPLITHFVALSSIFSRQYAGSIIRPHDGALDAFIHLGIPVYDILEAARDAGRQLATNRKISETTLKTISRQLIPKDSFIQEVYSSIRLL